MGKKKGLPPKRLRMNRPGRLANAKSTEWVKAYAGKNIIRGYKKWYGVDDLTAVVELRCLGVTISAEREEQLKTTIKERSKKREERKALLDAEDAENDAEWDFIAGYTAGGAPYGIESSSDLDP